MTIKKIMAAALSAVLCVVLSAAAFAESLVPGGGAVGIRMTTDGVVVAGVSEVETPNGKRSPAAEAGLKKGDVITRLGGADIGTAQDFKTALAQLDGSKTTVTIERGGKAKQLNITPAQDADGAWKLGLWLRDGVSGVGTLTFYDINSLLCLECTGAFYLVSFSNEAYTREKVLRSKQANLVPTGLHIDGDRLSYVTRA